MAQDMFRNQVYQSKDFAGMVTDNNIFSIYQQKPQVLDNAFRRIYSMYPAAAAVNYVNSFPVMEVEQENGFYQWMLKGQEKKNIPIVSATELDGSALPAAVGANRAQFILVFAEKFFFNTEVIKGETDDYHFLVKDSYEEDGYYKHKVELVNDDLDIAAPASLFTAGKRFTKLGGLTPSTLSYEGSEPWFSSPFKLQNRLSNCRMQYTVPGNMIRKGTENEPLLFPFMDDQGNVTPIWINHIDMKVKYQVDEYEAFMALYGKKNWDVTGRYLNFDERTKFEIGAGSGLFEQIAPGNQYRYSSFDIDLMSEMIHSLAVGSIERGQRTVTINTGSFGAMEFHKEIERKSSQSQFNILNTNAVIDSGRAISSADGGNTGAGSNALGYGYQFTRYYAYNGITFLVNIWDFLDDDRMFPARHPSGLGNVESHRMIVTGLGGDAGIKRVKVKGGDSDIMAVVPGLRDPYSPGGTGSPKVAVSGLDGYEVHCMKTGGLMVEDPTKILDWQLNVD